MPSTRALSSAIAVTLPTLLLAQADAAAGAEQLRHEQAAAAKAIRRWVDEVEAQRFDAKALLLTAREPRPVYMQHARWAGLLRDDDIAVLTHLDVLQRLLFFAEEHPNTALVGAVLDVASFGFGNSFVDRQPREVRDLAHWTLMRIKDQGAWFVVLRAAAGARLPVLDELRPDEPARDATERRVAALRLLGQRALPVFRSTLEAALIANEPHVRLAAAESIRADRVATVEKLALALNDERHPVVSQALVRALRTGLTRPPKGLDDERRRELVLGAAALLGQAGWRTDMDLLDLVEAFPDKAAIPLVIRALDAETRSPDALVAAVNRSASPLLRLRAGALLRAMTGALVAPDDVAGWREFWDRERNRLVVPKKLARRAPAATRATFFGVPVSGASIAFLTDTSGSMKDVPTSEQGPRTGLRRRHRPRTRLAAAKAQLTLATQAMPRDSRFFVLSFADDAHQLTPEAVRPNRPTSRSLVGLTSRLDARGGTNLYAGLVAALELDRRNDDTMPKIDELFVLSDGEPTSGDVLDADDLLELVRESNRYAKVRINTVITGNGEGADLLRRLAKENGGVFVRR